MTARIFGDMLKIYLFYSDSLSKELQNDAKLASIHYVTKKIRNLRAEIIQIIITFIQNCDDSNVIVNNIAPPLNEIFQDYCSNHPQIK